MQKNKKTIACDIFFDNVSLAEAVKQIQTLSLSSRFSYVVTPNVDHLARLCSSPNSVLHTIYRQAALSLCDSRILEKMLRFKGKEVQEVIPGSDLTKYLFDHVLTGSDKVLVVGVEDVFMDKLRVLYPSLNIQHINPSMGFIKKEEEVSSLLDQIKNINANYVFLCVGSPRQEILADKISTCGMVGGVGLCVGASILFIVGAEQRAPILFQRFHLEWAYRIFQDPRRLALRYFKNFLSLPAIMKSL